MNNLLILSIISFFFQNLVGYLKFKKIVNPISLFTIIHFFHNWSFVFSKHFNEIMFWRADPTQVSYSTMFDVLNINLIGSWAFFIVIIILAKTISYKNYSKIINQNILLKGYYFLSFIFFSRVLINLDPSAAYGGEQALDSISAFDPLQRIIFFRVIVCAMYILVANVNRSTILKILFVEIFLSIITFDRKDIALILCSYIIKVAINQKINFVSGFKSLIMLFSGFSFLMFIPIYRSINYIDGLSNKLSEAFFIISTNGYQMMFYILTLANSEGVQNWTYQLVENGEMTLLYGKSYLQAFINMFILRPFQGSTIPNWQGAYHFKEVAYPGITNQGWDFTFTAEAIQNFGPNLSFISFGILGLFISYFYSMRNKGDLNKIIYFFTWPILIIGFRMDSTSVFRLYSYVIFIYLIFYFSKGIKIDKKD